jgi:hypothetical protein
LARADALVAKTIAERDSIRTEAERAAARVANETTQQSDATREERDALTQRVAALDTRAGDAEREAGRYRQRWRTQQRLYMVIRGELEIAKDRIRALEGRPPRENRHLSPQIPESAETLEAEGDAELAELN